eukprot:365270-Chlamydomonas_euryale.AAC.10
MVVPSANVRSRNAEPCRRDSSSMLNSTAHSGLDLRALSPLKRARSSRADTAAGSPALNWRNTRRRWRSAIAQGTSEVRGRAEASQAITALEGSTSKRKRKAGLRQE